MHQEPGRPHASAVPLDSVRDEHGSDHSMVRACQRLRMKAARLFNRLAKLDRAKLKTGDTWGLYWMLKSVRHGLAEMGKVLLERFRSVIPDQARKLCRWAHDSIEVLQKYA